MKLIYNNTETELAEGTTLETFIKDRGIAVQGSAAAVDEEIVPKTQWKDFVLKDGMHLDVFSLVAGG